MSSRPVTVASSASAVSSPSEGRHRTRLTPRFWRGLRSVVLGEDVFRHALERERKRSDRFDEQFVLLLVASTAERATEKSAWAPVIEALKGVQRESDVLGWFEKDSALGLIVLDVGAQAASCASEVEARVRQALVDGLDETSRAAFSSHVYRYVSPRPATSIQPSQEPVPFLWQPDPLDHGAQGQVKRAFDLIGALALTAICLPLFVLISILIKSWSRGPIFYEQTRVGQHGRPFTMFKFRTMKVGADRAIHERFVSELINGRSPEGGDSKNGMPFKIVNDPRVTTIGRLLRKSSLDELPQLWNVIRGEMSLVGPRPPLTYEVRQYKPWHYRRVLEAKPGITGLWQVSGRSSTTFDDMVRLDLRYVKSRSIWTDVKILLATPGAVISGKGAV